MAVPHLTITLDRDGIPVELIGEADWRKAILKGYLRRDTIVTPYRRGKRARPVRADTILELRRLFDEIDPEAAVFDEIDPEADANAEEASAAPEIDEPGNRPEPETPEEPAAEAPVFPPFMPDARNRAEAPAAAERVLPAKAATEIDPNGPQATHAPVRPTGTKGWSAGRTVGTIVAILFILYLIGRCGSQPDRVVAPPVESPSFDIPVETPVEPMGKAEEPRIYQTSFICAGDLVTVERAICGNAYLAERDREMATLYAQRLQEADSTDDFRLAAGQRDWLTRRNSCASFPSIEDCLRDVYAERIAELRSWRPSEDRFPTETEEPSTPFVPDNSGKTIGGKPIAEEEKPRPTVDRSQPLRPISPNEWISIDDYPSSVREFKNPPTVGFTLEVDSRGRARTCTVTASSGSRSLDDATCRLLSRKARFHPQVDADGVGMDSTYRGNIRWEALND